MTFMAGPGTPATRPAPLEAISACRGCGSHDLDVVLDFGTTPIADRLMRPEDTEAEYVAPLTLMQCRACALCQIRETVTPRVLFGPDYPYFSSVSPALLTHFRSSAEALIATRRLGPQSLVVEAASNDGYMLEHFMRAGVPVLGIDPADGPVAEARKKGVETLHDFFTVDLARRLAAEGRQADVFLANNVLAHVANTRGFVAGIAEILAPDGIAVVECPSLIDLVDHVAFDTIYHQHLLYLSLTALVPLFAGAGLHVNDAERIRIHGGSLRLTISHRPGQTARLAALRAAEEARGVAGTGFFTPFRDQIARLADDTQSVLAALQAEGARVVGYGAAAKATTLLHRFGIGRDTLPVIHDKSRWKQGREMPVTRIPIVAAETLSRDTADVVLILAWNFAREIIEENRAFLAAGGRFLIPVPEVRVISHGDLATAAAEGISL